jgi:hypothetical protein
LQKKFPITATVNPSIPQLGHCLNFLQELLIEVKIFLARAAAGTFKNKTLLKVRLKLFKL